MYVWNNKITKQKKKYPVFVFIHNSDWRSYEFELNYLKNTCVSGNCKQVNKAYI